ncbi:thioredoxin-like protein [Mucilaginibacter frigoritolerans]|uniref:Thioredoxin-like protein n=1 Tax=Mucilaginibacter frigoritolerans TaxID=652788 RepID=A0A562U902_9SPHI|nr:thioredoxin fold domain-containing protein [Mucilaginibacter frigoritolerans]TWJ02272.1 thioredoxin-like protein [Mucilaginibacter frigoritolerans]
MKKLLFFFGLIIAAGCANAQSTNPPSYTPPATIPPYHILTTDSVYNTPANLKKNKAVMIIYFSPDCSHCQHLMYELKPKMDDFKNVQVVMITFAEPLKASQVFYRDFDLKKYPNFTVGTEGYTYVVQRFYQVRTTPYIALYDKNHKLVKYFDKAPKADEIADAAKKL